MFCSYFFPLQLVEFSRVIDMDAFARFEKSVRKIDKTKNGDNPLTKLN